VMCRAADRNELLGKWVFYSSNQDIPEKCRNSYLDFVSISKIAGSDGSRTAEVEYSAEKIESGYNLITKRVNSNGEPNCRGVPDEKTSTRKLAFFFIVLSKDSNYMKFFFSKDYYHIYKRVK